MKYPESESESESESEPESESEFNQRAVALPSTAH